MTARRSDSPVAADASRRTFLKQSALVGSAALVGTLAVPRSVHAAGGDTLKVALIGCGGRGNGAAVNAAQADPNVKITVLCDLFPDRLAASRSLLAQQLGAKFAVADDACFTGFDGYKQVMKTDVDVVLLATPPHFRPAHLKAAVEAGKHVFCEKPVAVDAPGVRSCLETTEAARQKGLVIVSGFCWRYHFGVRETIKRIKEGAIGDLVAIHENYLAGTLWHRGRQPDWSEMEFQCRNWLYFTWLSGDHNVEQHVHSLDKAMWLNDDQPPLRCFGLGGRQVRTDPIYGDVYDHHAVCYEFPTMKVFAYTRQMRGCWNDVEDYVLGAKGNAQVLKFTVAPQGEEPWRYSGPAPGMYEQEHVELFAAIRNGTPHNDGVFMTQSTMLAIMGRMAEYTGQLITWEQAMASQERLGPEEYAWGDAPPVEVAMPGVTKFV